MQSHFAQWRMDVESFTSSQEIIVYFCIAIKNISWNNFSTKYGNVAYLRTHILNAGKKIMLCNRKLRNHRQNTEAAITDE